jgi:peroxiredoxin
VQIVPVLPQKASAVRTYVEEVGLPFNILVDERRATVKAYGVWHRLGLDAINIARPAAFLINQDATIAWSFVGESQAEFPSVPDLLAAADRVP